jgi:hypothetical protein
VIAGRLDVGGYRRPIAVVALVVVAVAVARLAPAGPLAIAAAMAPVVIAGLGAATWLGVPLDRLSAVPIGLLVGTLGIWAVALVGDIVGPPPAVMLAVLLLVVAAGIALYAIPDGARVTSSRSPKGAAVTVEPGRSIELAIWLAVAVVVVLAVALGPYYPSGFDSPFHTAALRRLLEDPSWRPPDPYFAPASLPVPQYGLDPWYPVLAVLAAISGRDAMATLSGSTVALAGAAAVALVSMVRAAAGRSLGGGDAGRASPLPLVAGGLALAAWIAWVGAIRAGLDWRLLVLPEEVGLLVLVPATLTVLWAAGRPRSRRRLALLVGLGALAAPVHLLAAAVLGTVVLGELLVGGLRRDGDAIRPAIAVAIGLAIGTIVTAVPLVAMVAAVGADAFGQPGADERLLHLGPLAMLRPGVWLSSPLAVAAGIAAIGVLALLPRRPGAASLATGAIAAWLAILLPPVATVVVAVAGALYLGRIVTVPGSLGIPLLGLAAAGVLAWRAVGGAGLRGVVAGALAVAIAVAGLTVGVVLGSRGRDVPAWVAPTGRTSADRPDDRIAIRALDDGLAPYLPAGSVVLAEPATAYVLPTTLDVRVVAVPAVHSISTDPRHVNTRGSTIAEDDALLVLRRAGSLDEREAVLDRYAVTAVILDPARSGVDPATFAADYEGRLTVVATDIGPDRLAVLRVEP